ncbi:MAG: hypothetical protein IK122_02090 [Alphaproteobacteria bacterium]|nr:hypothetical protein [Alphaproteobacteria bacterium]
MRFYPAVFLSFLCVNAFADTAPVPPPLGPGPAIVQRVSVFSTTVDWAAVTGLTLNQYTGIVEGVDKKLVKDGLVLYYLDSFPCYGEADSVRVWLSPKGKMSGHLRIVCLYKPETISFAWRNATEDAIQARSTGILTCPIEGNRHFTIDISKCERGPDWDERK